MDRVELSSLHRRYLNLLAVEPSAPSMEHLSALVRAHLYRVPFENVSKLYFLKTRGFRGAPDLALFLSGIEERGFGGTCYSNNPHFYGLIEALGYDARLCGADMSEPDVHTTIRVRLDGREFLVDLGYGAPLDRPMPADLDDDVEVALGNERWVLKPRDADGRLRMEHHRDDQIIHGYVAKPESRQPEFFTPAVEDSYRPDATFMNTLRVVRFGDGWSRRITDLTVVHSQGETTEVQRLTGRGDVVRVLEHDFSIPPTFARVAVSVLGDSMK